MTLRYVLSGGTIYRIRRLGNGARELRVPKRVPWAVRKLLTEPLLEVEWDTRRCKARVVEYWQRLL